MRISPDIDPFNNNYTYLWSDGSTLPYLDFAAAAGDHIVTLLITDENGCTGSASESITILTAPNIAVGGDTITCLGDSVLLTLEGSFEIDAIIEWSDNTHIEGDSISCTGDSVLLTAIGNFEPSASIK